MKGYYYHYIDNGVKKRAAALWPTILKGFEIDLWRENHLPNYRVNHYKGFQIDGIIPVYKMQWSKIANVDIKYV